VFIDEHGNIAWDRDNTIDSKINWNNRIDICGEDAMSPTVLRLGVRSYSGSEELANYIFQSCGQSNQ